MAEKYYDEGSGLWTDAQGNVLPPKGALTTVHQGTAGSVLLGKLGEMLEADKPKGGESGLQEMLRYASMPARVATHLASAPIKAMIEMATPEHRAEVVAKAQAGYPLAAFGDAVGLVGMGAPVSVAMTPKGSAGIFHTNINPEAIRQARAAEARGISQDTIQAMYGIDKAKNGAWRAEVQDTAAKLGPAVVHDLEHSGATEAKLHMRTSAGIQGGVFKLSDVLDHPELYKAVPEMADYRIRNGYNPNYHGWFEPDTKTIAMRPTADAAQYMKTLLHEVNHAVADKHGLPPGGNSGMFLPENYKAAGNELWQRHLALNTRLNDQGINQFSVHNGFGEAGYAPPARTIPGWLENEAKLAASPDYQDWLQLKKENEAHTRMGIEADEKYNRLAGEVDSRNVEYRYENGYMQSPQSTETVRRTDQIMPTEDAGTMTHYLGWPIVGTVDSIP